MHKALPRNEFEHIPSTRYTYKKIISTKLSYQIQFYRTKNLFLELKKDTLIFLILKKARKIEPSNISALLIKFIPNANRALPITKLKVSKSQKHFS